MNITVEFNAQLKLASGAATKVFTIDQACSLDKFILQLVDQLDPSARSLLIAEDGAIRPSLLIAVNDEQVFPSEKKILQENDCISFLSPMSGG